MKKLFLLAFVAFAFMTASASAEKMVLPFPTCSPCEVR
jgi:hypothetical protein